ncbi:MAG TPA: hypothetical protein HPQ04_15085 [Rhodospirillaceae bacterium]|nr:hypothetical protein [Rhodospirillaceae bacterium]
MLRHLSVCLLAFLPHLALAAAQPADPAARRVMAAMNRLDADGKGFVGETDFFRGRAFAGTLFSALDANADGVVDRREFGARRNPRRAAWFHRVDRRRDGRLTFGEFRRGWDSGLFAALADGSGRITAASLKAGMQDAQPGRQTVAPPAPAKGVARPYAVIWPALLGRRDHWSLVFPW